MKGIYRISIGDKFYIGQCRRLAARMYQHERGINGCLWRYNMPRPYEISYLPIVTYLNEHPKVKTGTVEVIQRCVSSYDLMIAEYYWLQDAKGNPDCFNDSFAMNSRYLDESLWDISIGENGLIEYFDPADPSNRYGQFQKLTTHGEIWKRKSSKKDQDYIQQLLSPPLPGDTKP